MFFVWQIKQTAYFDLIVTIIKNFYEKHNMQMVLKYCQMLFLLSKSHPFRLSATQSAIFSLTKVEPNKVLRAKKSLSFVNLTYNTLRMIAFGFLVYSTFLPLKTALHLKCVFFSGFLVRLRVDILNIFQAWARRKEQKRRFLGLLRFNSCQANQNNIIRTSLKDVFIALLGSSSL